MARTGTSRDWMPSNRGARVTLAKQWADVMAAKTTEWKFTTTEVAALLSLSSKASTANQNAADGNGDRVLIALANEASRNLVALMRHFHARFLTLPFADSDWLSLGLNPRDNIRTSHTTVPEKVSATIRPGAIREVVVEFRIEGADHRAKPEHYDGAVVVWGVSEFPLVRIEDLNAGHEMASRTPHTLVFTDDQRGQTVSLALCWQNERGIRGEWSAILNTLIP